jgi:hypothetical protein
VSWLVENRTNLKANTFNCTSILNNFFCTVIPFANHHRIPIFESEFNLTMLIYKRLYCGLCVILALGLFYSCQKDIPVLGQDEQGNSIVIPRDSVFISSIRLNSFDSLTPWGALWDTAITSAFDSINFQYPDIFYNIGIYDETFPFSYYQQTFFVNVDPRSLPLVYYLVPPVQIPQFGKQFHLRVFDLELSASGRDSTFMDSIPFVVEPDFSLSNPYISEVTATGAGGINVTLGLTWR